MGFGVFAVGGTVSEGSRAGRYSLPGPVEGAGWWMSVITSSVIAVRTEGGRGEEGESVIWQKPCHSSVTTKKSRATQAELLSWTFFA